MWIGGASESIWILMMDWPILIRFNALWVAFMIFDGYDGSWMSHIDRKRDYDSFSRPKWNLKDWDFFSVRREAPYAF